MKHQKKIDFSDYIGKKSTSLVGRDSGQNLLKKLEKKNLFFPSMEMKYEKIIFIIPEKIITINKSFFLGLFETRIQSLGKEKFSEKYQFETSNHIKEKISRYIDSGLLTATMEEILDV